MRVKFTRKLMWLLMLGISTAGYAQKLSDVQEKAVLAPEKVKVDGKLTEWPESFAAYNKSTMVYYTLANDDKNLYLVLQSKDKATTNKIMRGGITFSINKEGKKKENEGPSVTFPVVTGVGGMRSFVGSMRPAAAGGSGNTVRIEMNPNNMAEMMKRADSAMAEANKRQIAELKEIKVLGMPGITDSLISIYNEYGVKAMAAFDPTGAFTYELAVPLGLLGLEAGRSAEFAYNLKLNGLQMPAMRVTGVQAGGSGTQVMERTVVVSGGASGAGGMPPGISDMMSMMSPTYLWGKYTLARK